MGNVKVNRILIYRLGSLGDTVVALPAFHLVARAFPNAERRLLTNLPVNAKAPAAAAVLAGAGLVDEYFHYPVGTRSLRELSSLWWQLVRWRPQVVIYMAAFRGQAAVARDSRFFVLCGIWRQIGVPLTEAMQKNLQIEKDNTLESEAERLARNLAELGEAHLDDPASWDIRLSAAEIAKAREMVRAAGGLPLIAISLGTKLQSNDWGAENWRALLNGLARTLQGYSLVICGAREELTASEAAAQGWRTASPAPVLNLCGKLTPRESAAVFAEAKIFIGHDSGPVHLAAAMQTSCVGIFGARNRPRVWFPYGKQHRVIYREVACSGCGLETCIVEKKRCIASITVANVLDEVRAVLARA